MRVRFCKGASLSFEEADAMQLVQERSRICQHPERVFSCSVKLPTLWNGLLRICVVAMSKFSVHSKQANKVSVQ
jgi:hypothetical protein